MGEKHPLGYLLALGLLSTVLGMAILLILTFYPGVLGQSTSYRLADEALRFRNLEAEFQHLNLSIPHGYIVPVLRTGAVRGIVILGQGQFHLGEDLQDDMISKTGHYTVADTFPALFAPISYSQLDNIRYALGAEEVPSSALQARAAAWLERTSAPESLDFFGTARRVYVEPSDILIHLMGDTHGQIVYQERPADQGVVVTFTDLANYRIDLPAGHRPEMAGELWGASVGASPFWVLMAFTILLFLLFGCLIAILTVDLSGERRPLLLGPLSRREIIILAVMVAIMVPAQLFILPAGTQGPGLLPPAGWIIPLCLAFLGAGLSTWIGLHKRGPSGLRHLVLALGLWPWRPLRSLFLGCLVGWLTFMVAYGAVPAVGQFNLSPGWWMQILWTILAWGLFQEVLYRGFFQTQFQRWLGSGIGLLTSALLVGVILSTPILADPGLSMGHFLRQGLLLSPLAALVSGYLFDRTGDLWAASVARGVYAFLMLTLLP